MGPITYRRSARGGFYAHFTTDKGNHREVYVEKALGYAPLPWTASYGGRSASGVTRDDAVRALANQRK